MKPWTAVTHQNTLYDSFEAGRSSAQAIRESAQGPLRGVMVFFSLLHEADALIRGIREVLGPDVPLIGSSSQGIVARDVYEEEGFFCGMLAWVGDLQVTVSCTRDIPEATFDKGAAAGLTAAALRTAAQRVSFVFYDPLCGVNARTWIRGFDSTAEGTRLFGAAAAGAFGPMVETVVIAGDEVLHGAAVTMTISGAFTLLSAASTGTVPSGEVMTVTKASGNHILELDGRPALEVWGRGIGVPEVMTAQEGSWAVGVNREGAGEDAEWTVLAPFLYQAETSALVLQVDVPEGTELVLHQRSPEIIFDRTRAMVARLVAQRGEREVGAMLGFECGARTFPFLGIEAAARENAIVQDALVGDSTAWLGLIAWGEIAPHGDHNEFFNYTYPLALLCHVEE